MRLLKKRVLQIWQERLSETDPRAGETERPVKAVHQKLDRLDEPFLFSKTIDLASYERQRDKRARSSRSRR